VKGDDTELFLTTSFTLENAWRIVPAISAGCAGSAAVRARCVKPLV